MLIVAALTVALYFLTTWLKPKHLPTQRIE